MTMKTTSKFFIIVFFLFFLCCKVKNLEAHGESSPCSKKVFSPDEKNYIFENWYKVSTFECEDENVHIYCKDYTDRYGFFKNTKQNGKWTAKRFFISRNAGITKAIDYICREEYFKNGLRDSIFKVFDKDNKLVYSTYFKNGTGLEKDFHQNGKLYYEIATKDGYFTDTLKLYNDKGLLEKKLLYKKDSLIYTKLSYFPDDNDDLKKD
jgi:antitoxin component YwqK of YwqJK toxin-antitoxin module